MRRTKITSCVAVSGICLLLHGITVADEKSSEGARLFTDQIQPALKQNCFECHGGDKTRAKFDLNNPAALLEKHRVVPGSVAKSKLFKLIAHQAKPHMPHKRDRMPESTIKSFEKWIRLGAPIPEEALEAAKIKAKPRELVVTDKHRQFWAFQPLQKVEPPAVKNTQWPKTSVDHFILARQEAKGLSPTGKADKRKLARRLYFDLIGLPPKPDEMEAFMKDESDGAWEKLVEQLLENPHYGERWGRHWLDVARFGESHGYEADNNRPNAYTYRDAVIEALNSDLPYDQFIKWQLAGDEYEPEKELAVKLTGFLAAGPTITNVRMGEKAKYEKLDDIVGGVGTAMLGLTLSCARCHDHKYDPIPTRDYYEVSAAFTSSRQQDMFLAPKEIRKGIKEMLAKIKRAADRARKRYDNWKYEMKRPLMAGKIAALELSEEDKELLFPPYKKHNRQQQELLKKYRKQIDVNDNEMRKTFTEVQKKQDGSLRKEMDRLRRHKPSPRPSLALVYVDNNRSPAASYLLARGDWKQKKGEVQPGFLKCLMPSNDSSKQWRLEPPREASSTWRRRSLAEWITDVEQGGGALLARVIVNRLWQHHFGRGIVGTSGNFGYQGERPSHPELLDWLAANLVKNGWRLKRLQKLILTSSVYMQGASSDLAKKKLDPDNRLLWSYRPIRLEAEIIRDSILAVSSSLNRTLYGPSIHPWIHTDAIATGSTRKWPQNVKDGPGTWRRSIYIFTKRSMLMPMLEAYDLPDSTLSCATRNVTTVAPAALMTLNNEFYRSQSRHFAERVIKEAGGKAAERVKKVYEVALGRPPAENEIKLGLDFLARQETSYEELKKQKSNIDPPRYALANYCQTVMGLNEFIYID
mgnify:CR=1 FL=1